MAFISNQLLYPMAHPDPSNEWLGFDDSFEFTSDYLDSNPTSANSFSPEDYSLTYSEADELNWGSSSGHFSQAQLQPSMEGDLGGAEPTQDPSFMFNDPAMSPKAGLCESPITNALSYDPSVYFSSSVRHLVEARASADPRCVSRKEKRREAAIAIHLQRLQEAVATDVDFSSDSNTSFSSPCWSDFVRDSLSPQAQPAELTTTPSSSSADNTSSARVSPGAEPVAGGVEMVLDLNMNAATNLPKKQKPRSQAQKESYIKVRKHGACEKHRKQHKRCNCLDKSATRIESTASTPATTTTLARPSTTRKPVKHLLQVSTIRDSSGGTPNLLQVIPNADRNLAERYTCLMPGCTYSSSDISSLDAHYAKHSFRVVTRSSVPGTAVQPRAQVHEQFRIRQPWSAVNVPPSVPGVSVTHSTQPVLQVSPGASPGGRYCTTARITHSTARVSDNSSAVSPVFASVTGQTARQSTDVRHTSTARNDPTVAPPGTVHSGVAPHRAVSHGVVHTTGIPGRIAEDRPLTEYASGVIRHVVHQVIQSISPWRSWSVVTSWAGAFFGRIAVGCCQQIVSAKRFGVY